MIGATAKAEQFYERSGSESTKGSRKGYTLLGGGENPLAHLSVEERRDSLVAVWKALQTKLAEAKERGDERAVKALGIEIAECGLAINAIRPKKRSSDPSSLGALFIDVCREIMTKPQFNAIMDEANRRQRTSLEKEQ